MAIRDVEATSYGTGMLLQTSPLCLIASHLGDEGRNGSLGEKAELASEHANHAFRADVNPSPCP